MIQEEFDGSQTWVAHSLELGTVSLSLSLEGNGIKMIRAEMKQQKLQKTGTSTFKFKLQHGKQNERNPSEKRYSTVSTLKLDKLNGPIVVTGQIGHCTQCSPLSSGPACYTVATRIFSLYWALVWPDCQPGLVPSPVQCATVAFLGLAVIHVHGLSSLFFVSSFSLALFSNQRFIRLVDYWIWFRSASLILVASASGTHRFQERKCGNSRISAA